MREDVKKCITILLGLLYAPRRWRGQRVKMWRRMSLPAVSEAAQAQATPASMRRRGKAAGKETQGAALKRTQHHSRSQPVILLLLQGLDPIPSPLPSSTMAPTSATHSGMQLLNLPAQPTIHHRLFLLVGRATGGGAPHQPNPNGPDGWIEVSINEGSNRLFPDQRWEVNDSWFKALIPLGVGNNQVRLTHRSLQGHALSEQTFHLSYQPVPSAKKVRLVVLCGKDSTIGHSPAQRDAQQTHSSYDHNGAGSNGQQHFAPPLPNRGISKFLAKAMNKLDGAVAGGVSEGSRGAQNGAQAGGNECTIDCPPGWRRQKLQHDGDLAISRRLALQAYLWQVSERERLPSESIASHSSTSFLPTSHRHSMRNKCTDMALDIAHLRWTSVQKPKSQTS